MFKICFLLAKFQTQIKEINQLADKLDESLHLKEAKREESLKNENC